jgi:hypothetical protein
MLAQNMWFGTRMCLLGNQMLKLTVGGSKSPKTGPVGISYIYRRTHPFDQATDHNSQGILTNNDSKDVVWHKDVPVGYLKC